jgi:hypothetical protein
MKFETGVSLVDEAEATEIAKALEREGIPVYQITTGERSDRQAVFDAVRATLPLDPPLLGSHSWDALYDSLWGGIHALHIDRVALIWPDATYLSDNNPEEFKLAITVLKDTAELLLDESATVDDPTIVHVYVGHTGRRNRSHSSS